MLASVSTLPCENVNVTKQATNNKLHGSVDTRLRCGGVVNNTVIRGFAATSVGEKKVLKSANIWESYEQERGCLVHVVAITSQLKNVRYDWQAGRHNI